MPGTTIIKQKFRSSIKRGTGEAHLLLRDNPQIDFSAEITKACIKNFAYDGQCESSRAPYLYELTLLAGKEERIKAAILDSLAQDHHDTWTLVQLFELAKLFAQNGYSDARTAIYSGFMKYPSDGADWAGYSEIIDLDGLDGLKFIASKMGEALQNDPGDSQDDHIIRYFRKENPNIDAWNELDQAGKHNSFIKTYMDSVRATTENRKKIVQVVETYSDAVEEVLLTKSRIRLLHRKWTKGELTVIAQRFIIEKNKQKKARLLRIFTKNKFPLDSSFILHIAKRRTATHISYFAFNALGYLKNDKVRNFAIDGILSNKSPQKYTIILKANYKKGDYKLLTGVINNTNNDALIELLMVNILEIYRFNKTKECAMPLEALYNKSTCAIHRHDVVKLLIENDVLPLKIKNELIFDCNKDIRMLEPGQDNRPNVND